MCAVSLIYQYHHAVLMGNLNDLPEVGADSVVCGVVHQDGLCLGVLLDGTLHLRYLHAQGYTQAVIRIGIHVDGSRAVHNQGVDDAAVHVTRQDDLLTALAGGKHHSLYGRCGTAHHEECMCGAECLGGQFFGLLDY